VAASQPRVGRARHFHTADRTDRAARKWVSREACATAGWPGDLAVTVNLSAAQCKHSGLANVIASALANSGLPVERLELEITRTILPHNSEATLAMLYQLCALGVHIAMDDFGTGYASPSYLQRFPFDKIKIDCSFVNDSAVNLGSIDIVRAVAALAQGVGFQATAEGVETNSCRQSKAKGAVKCRVSCSAPLPAREIEAIFLARRRAFEEGVRVA